LLKYVKSKTPAFVKQGVRHSVVDPTIRAIDAWRLHRAIVKLRSGKTPDRELLGILRRAWGNESFSADVTYLSELAARVTSCSGPILDCGSGLTTIVAAAIAEHRDLAVWALEQNLDWARHVTGVAARTGFETRESVTRRSASTTVTSGMTSKDCSFLSGSIW
jgi:hypothetical protein